MAGSRTQKSPPCQLHTRTLAQLMTDGIIIVRKNGALSETNVAAGRLLGYSRRELLKRTLSEILPAGTSKKPPIKTSPRTSRNSATRKLTYRRRDGTHVTLRSTVTPLANGEVLFVLRGTDRRQAPPSRNIDEYQDRINALVETNHEFFGLADLRGTITYINTAGRHLCGLPEKGKLPALTILDMIPDFFRPHFQKHIFPSVQQTGRWRGEGWIRRLDNNQEIPVEVDVFTVLHPRSGRPDGFATVIRDNSERKRSENELRRHAEELNAIHRVNTLVNASLSTEQVTKAAVQGIRSAIHADFAFLFLGEAQGLSFRDVNPETRSDDFRSSPEFRLAERSCTIALEKNASVYARDLGTDPRFAGEESTTSKLHSLAALPLRSGKRVIGAIGLLSYSDFEYASRSMFLETVADTISIGLTNAELYTTTKATGEALRESEERFRVLVQSASDAIFVQVDFRFVYLNDEALKLFGASAESQLSGQYILERVHPEYWDAVRNRTRVTSENERTVPPAELVYLRLDGTPVSVESTAAPITLGGRKGTVVFARNIQDRKDSERAVRESEERLKRAQAVAHVGNWELDMRTRSMWASEEAFRIYGVERTTDTLPLSTIQQMVEPAYRQRMDAALQDLIEHGKNYDVEFQIRQRDTAQIRFLHSWAEVVHDAAGRPVRIVGVVQDITDRKQAESSLVESEKRWHAVFDNSGIGIVLIDRTGLPIQSNRAFQQMLGYSDEELRERMFSDLSHPDDGANDFMLTQEMLKGKSDRYQTEKRFFRKGGEMLWTNLTQSVIRQDDGSVLFSIALVEDITERKQIQEALQESEELYKKLITTIPDVIVRTDNHGNVVFINETGIPELGYRTNERVLGRNILSFVAERDRDRAAENVRRMAETYIGPIEYTLVGDDGLTMECEVNGDVLRTMEGVPFGMVFLIRDVTERKRKEQALQESEYFLRKSQSVASVGSYYLDVISGRWVSSSALDDIFGITETYHRDINGWVDLLHPDQREEMQKYFFQDVVTGHHRFDKVYRIIRKNDGEERWVHGHGELEFDEGGNTVKMIGTIQDVTEHTHRELTIVAALHEKEVLLKEIHHRVKNNMQVISSLLSLQANRISDPSMKSILLESMNRIRSMALVHEKLYKAENLGSIDFRDYLKSMASDLSRSFYRENVSLNVEAESMQVGVDVAIPCGLIANELIANSFKHAFPDQREGTITVTLRRLAGNRAELRVLDNGIGIPMDSHDDKEPTLGMTIVNALSAQISGTLTVNRTNGTEVTLDFPL